MNRCAGMYYLVETPKSFDQASADLEVAVLHHGFSVLHVHNLGGVLRNKGMDIDEDCRVFEVCNYRQTANVLSADMRLNMALPWRISVFTDGDKTEIGLIRPTETFAGLSREPDLQEAAEEVEAQAIEMINEAR